MLHTDESTMIVYYLENDVIDRLFNMAKTAAIQLLAQSLNVSYQDAERLYKLFIK